MASRPTPWMKNMIAHLREEQSILRQQIDMLGSGKLETGERRPGTAWIDTTKQDLERVRGQLTEIDALLAKYDEGAGNSD